MEVSQPPRGAGRTGRGGLSVGGAVLVNDIWLEKGKQHKSIVAPSPGVDKALGQVIEGEIVPRLMLLHKQMSQQEQPQPAAGAGELLSGQLADFAELVIRHDVDVVEAYVKSLMQRGLDLETLLLHLLAPAARRLGELWEADLIDFVDVTIGTSRLQQLVRHLTHSLQKADYDAARRFLLLPAPQDQHTFGLVVVSELFRRNGWHVHGVAPMEQDELHELIADQSFVLIGFSLSCDRLINPLRSTIQTVRRFSKNQSVQIMVGGRAFAKDPASRPAVGADWAVSDAQEALELAELMTSRDKLRRDSSLS